MEYIYPQLSFRFENAVKRVQIFKKEIIKNAVESLPRQNPYGFYRRQAGLIGFQGAHGAYSEQAAFQFFGRGAKTLPCSNFDELFLSV